MTIALLMFQLELINSSYIYKDKESIYHLQDLSIIWVLVKDGPQLPVKTGANEAIVLLINVICRMKYHTYLRLPVFVYFTKYVLERQSTHVQH